MVLPLLGALAGAGGGIASALIGAGAQDEANQYNWMINLYNLAQRKRERREAREEAHRIEKKQDEGATDALGNRVHYVEGKGWVTELSDQQQELYDYFYNQELPERRKQFERNARTSREDADVANALLNEFRRIKKENPHEVSSLLYQQASRGIGEASREIGEVASRQGLRMGRNNMGDVLGDIGRQGMDARANARVDSKLRAKDYVDSKYNQARDTAANRYNMFATRAGNPLGASYDPQSIPASANSLMQVFANMAQQGNGMGMQALLNTTRGSLEKIDPNLAWANAAGAIGSSLSGAFERMGGYFDKRDMNELLKQYITAGGQLDLGKGGIFGAMTDRFGPNQGLF